MKKKDPTFPPMNNHFIKQQSLSFKVRSNLITKQKENIIDVSSHKAKANSIIKKIKLINSPSIIFALNQTVRIEASQSQTPFAQRFRTQQNSTFHSSCTNNNRSSHKSLAQSKMSKPRFYAFNQQRVKAINLSKWMNQKLEQIKTNKTIIIQDILEYNQTILNYGLGQIIQSVRKRCKQQGETLKMIWNNTIILFENLLNILTQQINLKDQQIIKNEKQATEIYLTNIQFLKKKNQQNQKHMDLLYQKMKKVILWNRKLRKDRNKQQIKLRLKNYRIQTYQSVLEEATKMLLSQSKQPSCLKLAKKIISKLCKIKTLKKRRRRSLQISGQQYVHIKTKQFVTQWLRKFSIQDDEKIAQSVHLTEDQKLQILKICDKNQIDYVDIYDFYQTKQEQVQTQPPQIVSVHTQIEQQAFRSYAKTKNIGIQTKRFLSVSYGIQCSQNQNPSRQKTQTDEKGIKQNRQKIVRSKGLKKTRKIQRQNDGYKSNQNLQNLKKTATRISQQDNLYNNQNSDAVMLQQQLQKDDGQYNQQDDLDNEYIQQEQSLLDEVYSLSRNQFLCSQRTFNFVSQNTLIQNCNMLQMQRRNQKQGQTQKNIKSEGRLVFDLDSKKNNMKSKLLMFNQKNSHRLISQPNQCADDYKPKNLSRKNFKEIFQTQMKNQYQQNKDLMMRQVMRRRSFYKNNHNRKFQAQRQLISLWYKPNRNFFNRQRKQFNQVDEKIYNYFTILNKNNNFPSNFSKSKSFQNTCSLFSSVALNLNNSRKMAPRNKQFITLSVSAIIKFFSRLLFDYIKKTKSQFDGFIIQSQRVFYPLNVILVDHMIHKYGLKQIAEKKLKDFMEKLSNFVGISQKINFFNRLLGIGDQYLCSDQLMIYIKCLVYFDVKRMIPLMNISKDFTIQRIVTDRQTVLAQIDQIIGQFFSENKRMHVKWKVEKYFITYQLPPLFDIERIASILIDQFSLIKKEQYNNYLALFRNCQGNFFPNLFKLEQMINRKPSLYNSKKQKIVQQFYKNADLMDQIYGKSISQAKFIGLCIRYNFPRHEQIKQSLKTLKDQFTSTSGLTPEYETSNQQKVNTLKSKYNIRICFDKQAPDYWLYTYAQLGYDISLINSYSVLGNLNLISNCFTKLCKNYKGL